MDTAASMAAISAEDPGVHFDMDRYRVRISHIACGTPEPSAPPKVNCSYRLQFRHSYSYEVATLERVESGWRIDTVKRVSRQR